MAEGLGRGLQNLLQWFKSACDLSGEVVFIQVAEFGRRVGLKNR